MEPLGGRIMIGECGSCARRWGLPRSLCPHCASADLRSIAASGRGRLYSVTLVHRAPSEMFKPLLPYRIGLVDLEEGPRLMVHLENDGPIGACVCGRMEDVAGERVPVFQCVVASEELAE